MGLQRKAPVSAPAAGAGGLIPAATWSGSPGRFRTTSPAAPFSRTLISRYSALKGSTKSQGRPAPDAAFQQCPRAHLRLPRARRAADEHVPVHAEGAGPSRAPAGVPLRSSTLPRRAGCPARLRPGEVLRGDVEFRAQRKPDTRHLHLGHPRQRRTAAPCSRRRGTPPWNPTGRARACLAGR